MRKWGELPPLTRYAGAPPWGEPNRPLRLASQATCLAAARSRSGSESRLGFHSMPERRYATREWEAKVASLPAGGASPSPTMGNGDCAQTVLWEAVIREAPLGGSSAVRR